MGKGECATGCQPSREALNVARWLDREAFSSRANDHRESLEITECRLKNHFSWRINVFQGISSEKPIFISDH